MVQSGEPWRLVVVAEDVAGLEPSGQVGHLRCGKQGLSQAEVTTGLASQSLWFESNLSLRFLSALRASGREGDSRYRLLDLSMAQRARSKGTGRFIPSPALEPTGPKGRGTHPFTLPLRRFPARASPPNAAALRRSSGLRLSSLRIGTPPLMTMLRALFGSAAGTGLLRGGSDLDGTEMVLDWTLLGLSSNK